MPFTSVRGRIQIYSDGNNKLIDSLMIFLPMTYISAAKNLERRVLMCRIFRKLQYLLCEKKRGTENYKVYTHRCGDSPLLKRISHWGKNTNHYTINNDPNSCIL